MTVHIGLFLACFLALASVYADSDGCFVHNIHYIGHRLSKPGGTNNYGPTGSAKGCQLFCQQMDGCGWFNWEMDKCWLKTGKGNETRIKSGGITGPRICAGPVLLHDDSLYKYYKVQVRPGQLLLSHVIKQTCELHGMTPQFFDGSRQHTDEYESRAAVELKNILCGRGDFSRCGPLKHTFWYVVGSASAWGNNQGTFTELGEDITSSDDNQYFTVCVQLNSDENE